MGNGNGNGQNGNHNGKPGRAPRIPRPVPDLHSPDIDATGRVDVLVARSLRLAVERINDPVLRSLYSQFQPLIDEVIHHKLKRVNARRTFEEMGLVPRARRRNPTITQERARRSRRDERGL